MIPLTREEVIDYLQVLKSPQMRGYPIDDIIDNAIEYLTEDAPIEAEVHDIVDYDTGRFIVTEYFCGNCHRLLSDNKKFCKHCGKKVKWRAK